LKKLLFGFLFVLVGLFGAILVAPNFVNWNEYREIITEEVNAATGFNLEIRGDIKIGILPSPALLINDVHVANIEGAHTADTLTVDSFEVRVALAPLLGRQLQIRTVKLVRPVLSLEVLSDGRTNMAFKGPAAANSAAPASKPASTPGGAQPFGSLLGGADGGALAIQLDDFVIEKGSISYRDDTKGQVETIENLNGRFALASLSGPMESSGSAVVRGIPMSFAATAGTVVQGRTLPFNFDLKVIPGETNLRFSGAITRLNKDPQVKGKLNVEGKNLGVFASAISGGIALPESLSRPFSTKATIAAAETGVTVSDLAVKLNGTQGTGKLVVKLGDVTDVNLRLAVNKFDVDALLAPKKAVQKPKSKSKNKSGNSLPVPKIANAQSGGAPFSLKQLPKNLTAALNISVGAVTYNKSVIRQAKINATLDDQEITISQASALLPGSTDVGLLGTILEDEESKNKGPIFEGNVDLSTNNLRALLNWVGTDVSAVAKDRLRKFSFGGKVTADAKAARLNDISVQLDETKMTGAANIAFRARPSFGVDLAIDRLNLDGYLPKEKPSKASGKASAKAGPAKEPATKTAQNKNQKPVATASVPNPLAALAALGTFDANINASLKALTVKDVPIKGLSLNATVFDGKLKVTKFQTANAAGLAVNVSGDIVDLKKTRGVIDPQFDNFKFNIRGKSLARLFSLAKFSSPVPAGQIGAVRLAGTLSGKPRALKVSTNTSMLGGKFSLSGLVEPLRPAPRVDGKFSATHPSLVKLVRRLGSSYRPAGKKIGGVNLSGRLKGDAQRMSFPNLAGSAAGITIAGSAATDLSGARPKVIANLETSPIVIDDILPAKQTAFLNRTLKEIRHAFSANPLLRRVSYNSLSRGLKAPARKIEVAVKGVAAGAPWTKAPIDLLFLKGFDGDIKLRSKRLRFQKYQVDAVNLASLLTDGVVDLQRLTGKAYGGDIKIDGQAIAAPTRNQYQTRFEIKNMDTGRLLSSLGTRGFRRGALNMVGEFRTIGRSTLDLVRTLSGGGTIAIRGLDISNAAKSGSALSGFANLFLSLNQFGSTLTGGKASSKQADFNTSFRLAQGIARFEDMSLRSGLGNGAAKGAVDLPNWRIDTAGEIQLSQNILAQILLRNSSKKPNLPFKISGRLDDPKVKLETAALTKGGIRLPGSLNKKLDKLRKKKGIGTLLDNIFPQARPQSPPPTASTGAPPPQSPPPQQQAPQQQQQQKPRVEDFLKGILKGIGR
jgi:uncharacterized protein involved in outer membrane biogenesis